PSPTPTTPTSPVTPSEPETSEPATTEPTSAPAPSASAAESPTQRRKIRDYPDHPRHLIPRLFGTENHLGSQLIMPQPRKPGQGPVELETLPPISEDELNAIKAELISPGRANRTPETLNSSQIDERQVQHSGWWPVIGFLTILASGILLWAFSIWRRRQP